MMKQMWFVMGAVVGVAGTAHADSTVYPTGRYPDDVQRVQAAADGGGVVTLEATNESGTPTAFNFGTSDEAGGYVTFNHSVQVVGNNATIVGGWDPFFSYGAYDITIRGITFERPFDGAILVYNATSLHVVGNHFEHVQGRYRVRGFPVTFAETITASAGAISITDNVIDSIDAGRGIGVEEFASTGPVEVRRNQITGSSDSSIECGGPAHTEITDNVLRPGTSYSGFGGYGIEINGNGTYYVANNDVVVETPGGIGIWAFGTSGFNFGATTAPVIVSNHIVLQPIGTLFGAVYTDGIDLAGEVSGAYIGQNRIEGNGFSAFSLYAEAFGPNDPSDLASNTFVGNNISGLNAWYADLFLDTVAHDTVLKGSSGTVVDLGTNNHISGFSHQAQTGSQVSAATASRNDARKLDAANQAARPTR